MNTANIKKYAPKARNAFIAAVTKQAARYGVTAKGIKPIEQRGDVALIGEQAFPKAVFQPRRALEHVVEQMGFAQAMEQAAYSWFNRLCAIRYMEIHGYLDHGRRVLSGEKHSSADGEAGAPQILDDCLDIDLPGLSRKQIEELKLDGNKDEELYRELLLAQCHALHEAMPFLFEAVDDATELLLPDNLTKTDSLVRELVSAIPEDNWQDVEIIGWLYQFYISEKKDQVIGKVVKSEDIPAATQLFTPNWIVQYLVQNSVGRQWLQTYPDSPLKSQMPYFIESGEQPPEVQTQLADTVPASIDPESIKVLDPACGSGHILTEAYKVLKAIYEERGYRSRDIPQLILKHNLFGLDIDDRAGQLAGFALMMLAREDDRRLFSRVADGDVTLNVLSLKETGHLDLPQLWRDLNLSGDWQQGSSQSLFESEQTDLSTASADERYQLLERTLERFTEAKTFGSLIEVPEEEAAPLKKLQDELEHLALSGDSMQKSAAATLLPYVRQAWVLSQRYDAVIANPPYMGTAKFTPVLKKELAKRFKVTRSDLYAIFMENALTLVKHQAYIAMITMQGWMFTTSYEELRDLILTKTNIITLAQLGARAFPEISGEIVQSSAFVINAGRLKERQGVFLRLTDGKSNEKEIALRSGIYRFAFNQDDFNIFPQRSMIYWASNATIEVFNALPTLNDYGHLREGIHTGKNDDYLRLWWEVQHSEFSVEETGYESIERHIKKWFPYNKGGRPIRWYGGNEYVIAFNEKARNDMAELTGHVRPSQDLYFKEGATWSDVSSSAFGAKYFPDGFLFDAKGPVYVGDHLWTGLAVMNSKPFLYLCSLMMPTLSFKCGTVKNVPVPVLSDIALKVDDKAKSLISIAHRSSASDEVSWDYTLHPLLFSSHRTRTIEKTYGYLRACWHETVNEMQQLEKDVNRIFIDGYGFQDEMTPDVPIEHVALACNTYYRYGSKASEAELEARLKSDTVTELISYTIGCMMGRYSLDKPGLILASQGETLQDYLEQIPSPGFAPDENAILPLTDQEWFPDDATNRFREFIRVVWGDEHLQENLDFVAESLCLQAIKSKRGESALDTIRRYLSTQFYKDHLHTYKKRPIYWLFSSGKQKAFECLVYLHRYNESTLARMRTEYVIPLSAKLNAYADKLEQDKDASTSTAETKRLEKEVATLHKQQTELAEFDEKLRHYADQRISLNLDEGVKVNYGRFGDLLANIKDVTGNKPE
jgi:type II restriction/modification system DNA methylase subunit YeeA